MVSMFGIRNDTLASFISTSPVLRKMFTSPTSPAGPGSDAAPSTSPHTQIAAVSPPPQQQAAPSTVQEIAQQQLERHTAFSRKYAEFFGSVGVLIGEEECAICLDDIDKNDRDYLPCAHYFHSHCIKRAIISIKSNGCPICRIPAFEKEDDLESVKRLAAQLEEQDLLEQRQRAALPVRTSNPMPISRTSSAPSSSSLSIPRRPFIFSYEEEYDTALEPIVNTDDDEEDQDNVL